jgi:4-nitrophenyl phosphatase
MITGYSDIIKTLLLDMDGVLWRGDEPVVDLNDLFKRIDKHEWHVLCITNNSTRTIKDYLKKLRGFDVHLRADQLITSAEATSEYLAEQLPSGGSIYVIGESGLLESLRNRSFRVQNKVPNEDIDAVVVGLDREFNYQKLHQAARFVSQGIPLVGTNPDRTIPTPEGLAPGAGSIISAVEAASGKKAFIVGKPDQYIFQMALERSNSKPEQTIMIGDRLETDIKGAQELGIRTGLVLSGVSSREMVNRWSPNPDLIANNIEGILDLLIHHES